MSLAKLVIDKKEIDLPIIEGSENEKGSQQNKDFRVQEDQFVVN